MLFLLLNVNYYSVLDQPAPQVAKSVIVALPSPEINSVSPQTSVVLLSTFVITSSKVTLV